MLAGRGARQRKRETMKKIRVEDAVGKELCHDITAVKDGFKGALFKRGHIIEEKDIEALLDIGKRSIFAWEDNAGEIHEEDAALRLAALAQTEYARQEGPSEGKILIRADRQGMFTVNTGLLKALNSIEDITFTTIPDHYPVKEGDRIASVRIVPLVTKEANIAEAEKLCGGKSLIGLLPYKHMKVGVVITGSEIYHGRIKDKFEPVIRKKLKAYPCEIAGIKFCDDELDMITGAAKDFIAGGAGLVVFSGGMSVDPGDLTPTAIRTVAEEVVTYGVPSQPGNMTMIAYSGDTALVGVPGAAISSPVTVLDVLLPQLFTGKKFTKQELVNLGAGGLCMQCGTCHFPNCGYGKY